MAMAWPGFCLRPRRALLVYLDVCWRWRWDEGTVAVWANPLAPCATRLVTLYHVPREALAAWPSSVILALVALFGGSVFLSLRR